LEVQVPTPKIDLATKSDEANTSAVVLVWFAADAETKGASGPKYLGGRSKEIDELAQRLTSSHHFAGKKNELSVLRFYGFAGWPCVMLVGAGSSEKFSADVARQLGASVFKCQKKEKLESASVRIDSLLAGVPPQEQPYYLQAFCEGYWLASYEYVFTKPASKEAFYPKKLDLLGAKNSPLKEVVDRGQAIAEAMNFARSLGDKPPNILNPEGMATLVTQMAKGRKLKVTVLGQSQLEREKMGALLGVAQGSDFEPKLIQIEYRGGKKGDKPVALLGKGVTFDSGGISIKPAAGMDDMKFDMMGAGTVAGVMQAIADLEIPLNVTGFIGAVENMPSGKAQRPADVVVSSSGKTIEITNTDAEGRLVLADVITYAQKQKPQAMIDVATLTGAVIVALGNVATGIMGNNAGLIGRIKTAAKYTGEKVWELPLFDEYEEDLKTPYADIRNAGNREAGSSKGGMFLKFFVDKSIPWVHCDIAGTANNKPDLNYNPAKGASGAMIRCLTHMLETWQPLQDQKK